MNQVIIRTSTKGTGYYVNAPYNAKALDAWRAIPGRKFDRTTKEHFIPLEQKRPLWNLLRTYYAGQTLVTDLVGTIGPIPQSFASDQWRVEVQAVMDKELDVQVEKLMHKEACEAATAELNKDEHEAAETMGLLPAAFEPITGAEMALAIDPGAWPNVPRSTRAATGWDIVELPAVSKALSKRAARKPKPKRSRRTS